MRKRLVLLLSIAIILSICVTSMFAAGSEDQSLKDNIYYQLGKTERPARGITYNIAEYAFEGNTVKIKAADLEQLVTKKEIAGQENPEENAICFLLRNEALYQMALSLGYVASESEIEDLIQEMKDYYHSDDAIGIDVVTAYIAGTGMTPDAYFENQYDIYKKDFIIGHYLEDVKAEYMEREGITQWSQDTETAWQAYLDEIAFAYIKADQVVDLRQIEK